MNVVGVYGVYGVIVLWHANLETLLPSVRNQKSIVISLVNQSNHFLTFIGRACKNDVLQGLWSSGQLDCGKFTE